MNNLGCKLKVVKKVLFLTVLLSTFILTACANSNQQSNPEVKVQGKYEGAGGYSSHSSNSK